MKKTKDNLGIALVQIVVMIIISLILIMVLLVEIYRGIFEHTNKYVTEIDNATSERKNIENQFVEKYEEYL